MAGEFDEMDFYTGLKDFSASERLIVFSLLERLYNIRIFDGPLGDPEQKFTTIHRKIEDSKNHVTKKKENEEENTDNHRFQDESFLNTTRSKKVAAHKSVEHRGLSTKGEEEAYLREFTEISLISNSFFIAFQSVLAKIPSCGEIITPNETYQALRKTLWGNGIPEEFIAEVFRLYLTEKYKEGGLPRRDLLQKEIYEISNVLKEFSPPLRVKAISEVVLSSILNKKSRNSIPFNFPETYNRNLARYREKFQVSENSDGEEWDEILHAIQNEKEYLISNLIALLKKSSSP